MAPEAIGDLAGLSAQLSALVSATENRIVAVRGPGRGNISGMVWRTGLIVTAHEALEGEDELSVGFAGGGTAKAELAGRDPSTDVALLRAETGDFADWKVAPTPSPGALALVVGRSEHSALAAFGMVSEVGAPWQSMRGGRIDARISLGFRINPRAEGGAAIAADGSLIGMAVAGPRRSLLAIPASTIDRAVATLLERGYVARGYLGVALHPLARGAGVSGAVVVSVEPGSPAAQGGLLIGDIITTWDGEPVHSAGGIYRRLGTDTVGRTVTLGVLRGGANTEVRVTIGERPRA